MMIEGARIARGNITPINKLDITKYDTLIFPGGFGAAKNLCDFALKGKDYNVNKDITSIIKTAHQQQKPMGFICIAPMLAAHVIPGVTVTIGNDQQTAEVIQSVGAVHQECEVTNAIVDEKNKVVSTPAYMLANNISDVSQGCLLYTSPSPRD